MLNRINVILAVIVIILVANIPGANSLSSCSNLSITIPGLGVAKNISCYWVGGNLSLYVGTGQSGWANIKIVGQDGITYFSNSTTNWCLTKMATIEMPSQDYTINVLTGKGGGNCQNETNAKLMLMPQGSSLHNTTASSPTNSHESGGTPSTSSTVSNPSTSISAIPTPVSQRQQTSKGNGLIGILIFVIIVSISIYAKSIGKRGFRSNSLNGSSVFNSSFLNNAVAYRNNRRGATVLTSQQSNQTNNSITNLMNDPRFKILMARDPQLAGFVIQNLQRRGWNGTTSIFRGSVRKTITYTGESTPDSFDGM
ncbi:MAG: hypothetical protein ACP5TL_01570 [Candidatus Micrarchaeia archaeon]